MFGLNCEFWNKITSKVIIECKAKWLLWPKFVITQILQSSYNFITTLVADPGYHPEDPKELCNRIFVTVYMGTKNSSEETKSRAALLGSQIGSHHLSIVIDKAVTAMMEIFTDAIPGYAPRFAGKNKKFLGQK